MSAGAVRLDRSPSRAPGKRAPRRSSPYLVAIAPAALLLSFAFFFPAAWAIYTSMTSLSLTDLGAASPQFVGLDNYRRLLDNPDFPKFLRNTLVFVLGAAVIGQTLGGLAVALLIHQAQANGHRLATAAFGAVLLAWVCPPTLAGFIWGGIFDYRSGMLNAILTTVGLGRVDMLGNHAMFSVILVESWRGLAFAMIIFLGALQTIPAQIYEAARVDGSPPWRRFWDHTLPSLRHIAALVLMMTTIVTTGSFLMILILTNGDPAYQTETIALNAYHTAFAFFEIGYGAAISVVMLLINIVFAVIYLRLARAR